jgi:hypothetical protein
MHDHVISEAMAAATTWREHREPIRGAMPESKKTRLPRRRAIDWLSTMHLEGFLSPLVKAV